ncbi:MAG: hypothetical protein ABI163_17340 [Thermoanaerobaculia bacterium]
MANAYGILDPSLFSIAEQARQYFTKKRGLGSFNIEVPVLDASGLRPTLSAVDSDKYVVCIEVRETIYHPALDTFILDCKNRGLPIKLYIAVPASKEDAAFKADVRRASENGIGVLSVEDSRVQAIREALYLSLTGIRPVDADAFPRRYRGPLTEAEEAFRGGNPVKGCGMVFDEIEALTRTLAKKTFNRGLWRSGKLTKPPLRFDKDSWQLVTEKLVEEIDPQKVGCPNLTRPLFGTILGLVPHRNESGHKVRDTQARLKRDAELRTRFEHARDVLKSLVDATKSLRL